MDLENRSQMPDLPEREESPFDEMVHRFEGQYGRTREDMVRAFGEAGWQKCGHGKNGRVAASPCGRYVVRVSGPDNGFDRHAELCQTHADNKHFPKVHAHRTLPDGSLVTVMEKLDVLPRELHPQRDKLMTYVVFGEAHGLPRDLRDAADVIRAQKDIPRDLHGGDVMFRTSDRTLVIVDPYR
ncbi:MAG: hypothetical protein GC134_09335 [Proteobacteria bacterium]|nr:hypothetical protein [Pseudomonadota bacterium]